MEFDELYEIIEKKNSILVNNKTVTLTQSGFRKALKLAYDKGKEEGIEIGNSQLSIFEKIFGKI